MGTVKYCSGRVLTAHDIQMGRRRATLLKKL